MKFRFFPKMRPQPLSKMALLGRLLEDLPERSEGNLLVLCGLAHSVITQRDPLPLLRSPPSPPLRSVARGGPRKLAKRRHLG